MKGIRIKFPFLAIQAEKDGETDIEKNALKLLQRLGVTGEQIAALKKGELDLEESTKAIEEKFEKSVSKRIEDDVEKRKTKEIFAAIYDKTEKRICKVFGLSHDDYKDIEEKDRIERMFTDAKKVFDEKIEQYKGVDSEKLKALEKKYQDQLDAANKEKAEALTKAEQAQLEAEKKIKGYKIEQAQGGKIQSFIKGIKAPAFDEKVISSIIDAQLLKGGYNLDLEEGENGRIFLVDKEGKRIKSKKVASENLTLDEFLSNVSEEYGFEAKNNIGGFGNRTGQPGANPAGGAGANKFKDLTQEQIVEKLQKENGFRKDYIEGLIAKGVDLTTLLKK